MPMIRAMRLLNAIEAGTTTGAQLQALLTADPGRLAEFNVLLDMRGQTRRMAASSTAMTAVLASSTAMTAVLASSTAMTAVAASGTAMTAVLASSTAMTAVAASSTAMNAVYASPSAVMAIMPSAFMVFGPHTGQITLSGSEVTQWNDSTGNGRHLLGSTAGARPTFSGTAMNGYTTLEFDGSNDKLVGNANFTIPDACTVFIVSRKDGTGNYGLVGSDTTTDNGGLIEVGTALYVDYSGGANTYPFPLSTVAGVPRLISGWGTDNTTNLRLNANTPVRRSDCNLLGAGGTRAFSVGFATDPGWIGNMFFDGKVAEVIVLGAQKAPGDAEYDRIVEMLRTKYALW